MPMPESRTVRRKHPSPRCRATRMIPPSGVNLKAFESRLVSIISRNIRSTGSASPQFAVRRAPAVHAARNGLDEVVGIVNRRVELLPRAGNLRRRGVVGVGRNLAERGRRTALALSDVGRNREQQRQVVRIGVLIRQVLVNTLEDRLGLLGVVQVIALAGLRIGFLVEQVGARGEQQTERHAV